MLRRKFLSLFVALPFAGLFGVTKPADPWAGVFGDRRLARGPVDLNKFKGWKNYTARYTNVNREELIEKIRKAVKTQKFRRPKAEMIWFRDNPIPLRTTLND